MSRLVDIILLYAGIWNAFNAQDNTNYYVTVNSNLLVPSANSSRYTYPIIGYNKELDNSNMIGGFGLGFTMDKPINDKLNFKPYVHVSRIRYWDEAGRFGSFTDTYFSVGTSTVIGLGGLLQVEVPGELKIGTGLSSQILVKSKTEAVYSDFELNSEVKSYKRLLLTIPIEMQLSKRKMQYAIRYEHSLMNAYNKNLKDYLNDRYGVLFFTVGYKLK
jgi:hypothetical protein